MKRNVFSDGFIALAILFCLLSSNFTAQSQTHESHDSAQNVSVTEDGQCVNLGKFLQDEFSKNSKVLKDNHTIRIVGVQEKDAIVRALNICIKLKANEADSDGKDLIYELPDGLGSIVIQEVKKNDIYLKVKLITACDKLPFTEIWYVSLSRYNKG
ncbi:hypothetical protein FACS189432_01750 [Bacteroidia bacterium]|nr:hypothetical protein FACS189432_01750 [Bacteroidia bacterium]